MVYNPASSKAWRDAHKELRAQLHHIWYLKNKEKVAANRAKYLEKKKYRPHERTNFTTQESVYISKSQLLKLTDEELLELIDIYDFPPTSWPELERRAANTNIQILYETIVRKLIHYRETK